MSDLNARQQTFVREYLVDFNATRAAERAGYSVKASGQIGYDLLKKTQIAAEIQKLHNERLNKLDITPERVLAEMAKCGYSNMQDYMSQGPDGDPMLDWSKLTRDQAAALTEVTVERYTEGKGKDAQEVKKVKFKLADKLSALDKMARHLGLFQNEEKSGGDVKNLSLTLIQVLQQAAQKQ